MCISAAVSKQGSVLKIVHIHYPKLPYEGPALESESPGLG